MQTSYTTSDIAGIIGIHPNTVRLYEKLHLISAPKRKENGYRIFTNLHIEQFRIARLAFEVEVLQNGLRKRAVEIIKACARCEFEDALQLTGTYLNQIESEKRNAEQALQIVEQILTGANPRIQNICFTRKQAAEELHVTIDTLRNWELNGLITVKRRKNGYRVYNGADMRYLTIIKSLRCAGYSLSAILRMLLTLSEHPRADFREALETSQSDDIITACDNLLTSLQHAKENALKIQASILILKKENF